MAFDAFLKLEGVKGSAMAKGFEKEIPILSFSIGGINTRSSAETGAGAGKGQVQDFSLMKYTDKASPTLFQACLSGQHFPKASITLRKAGGTQIPYLTFDLEEVFITSFQQSGSSGSDVPNDSFSLSFAKIETTYQPQDAKGNKDGEAIVGAWDVHAVATK